MVQECISKDLNDKQPGTELEGLPFQTGYQLEQNNKVEVTNSNVVSSAE